MGNEESKFNSETEIKSTVLRDCRFVTIHEGARRDAPFEVANVDLEAAVEALQMHVCGGVAGQNPLKPLWCQSPVIGVSRTPIV